jgi:hypothetical protein
MTEGYLPSVWMKQIVAQSTPSQACIGVLFVIMMSQERENRKEVGRLKLIRRKSYLRVHNSLYVAGGWVLLVVVVVVVF